MIDSHTHSLFSHDSFEISAKLIEQAISLGLDYFAITNHLDNDCRYNYIGLGNIEPLDVNGWICEIKRLKEEYGNKLNLALGLEIGFDIPSQKDDENVLKKFPFDVIINSVHNVSSTDIYYPTFFKDKEKNEIYTKYLLTVKESLSAYDYDILGHIGYIMRKAPYKDKIMKYKDHSDIIDEILALTIQKNKTVEINSHSEGTGLLCFPPEDILKRYRQLGGENIVFGSDAHRAKDICRNYEYAKELALKCGFEYWTCYKNRKIMKIGIR